MTASRRRTDNVPAKKSYREPSTKTKKKWELQQFVYDLAKSIFNRSLRFVDARARHRKKEYYYKIKVTGMQVLEEITAFSNAIRKRVQDGFKLSFSGVVNPKTGKEDLFLYLVIFNREGSYEAQAPNACECSETQCFTGIYAEEEIGFDSVFAAS